MEAFNFQIPFSLRLIEVAILGEKFSRKEDPDVKLSASDLNPIDIVALLLFIDLLAFEKKPYLKKLRFVK